MLLVMVYAYDFVIFMWSMMNVDIKGKGLPNILNDKGDEMKVPSVASHHPMRCRSSIYLFIY